MQEFSRAFTPPFLDTDDRTLIKLKAFIILETHYEKSDWSRAFNQQFKIACELDMINAISISAADIAIIMSSSTSAWLLSPLECPPQKQNG